jgi:peptidoglycan/xylan/chitin deacetylase (PgdA/CDA1 family)
MTAFTHGCARGSCVVRRVVVLAFALVAALCGFACVARAATPQRATIVSITFDDGFASQLRAVPILRHYHARATFYLNSELLNGVSRLTFAQVRALEAAGMEIGGHTSDHTSLVTVDRAEARRQICNDRVALSHITGRAPRSFAYPYGASNRATERLVRTCGYSSARIVGGLTCPRCARAESLRPARRFHVRTSYSFVESTRVADAKRAIKRVARHGGGWVPLVFHEVCDHCSEMGVSPGGLRSLLAWISAHRSDGIVVRTVGAVVGGPTRRLVHAPIHAGPYALLLNSRLAQPGTAGGAGPDVGGDGVDMQEATRCWRRAGYGRSRVVWSRRPVGIDGSMAETVAVTGYVSGDRKLVVRPDGGSCSVRVLKGVGYRISVWYRSTMPISLAAYVRSSAGRWRFWTKSPAARPSRGWSRASFDLPPVPAGVGNISFGATLVGNGRMTVDNFGIAVAPRAGGQIAIGLGVSPRTLLGSLLFGLVLVPVVGAAAYDRVRRWRSGHVTRRK